MIEVRTDGRGTGAPAAVALGSFDGVHRGHEVLLRACVEEARARGILSAVYTLSLIHI